MTVTVAQINSYRVYVVGRVTQPGEFTPDSPVVNGVMDVAGDPIPAGVRNMIRNIIRLQDVHLRLSAKVMRRGRGDGRKALKMLEMERARHQFFARTTGPGNKYRKITNRHFPDHLEYTQHHRGGADHIVKIPTLTRFVEWLFDAWWAVEKGSPIPWPG